MMACSGRLSGSAGRLGSTEMSPSPTEIVTHIASPLRADGGWSLDRYAEPTASLPLDGGGSILFGTNFMRRAQQPPLPLDGGGSGWGAHRRSRDVELSPPSRPSPARGEGAQASWASRVPNSVGEDTGG